MTFQANARKVRLFAAIVLVLCFLAGCGARGADEGTASKPNASADAIDVPSPDVFLGLTNLPQDEDNNFDYASAYPPEAIVQLYVQILQDDYGMTLLETTTEDGGMQWRLAMDNVPQSELYAGWTYDGATYGFFFYMGDCLNPVPAQMVTTNIFYSDIAPNVELAVEPITLPDIHTALGDDVQEETVMTMAVENGSIETVRVTSPDHLQLCLTYANALARGDFGPFVLTDYWDDEISSTAVYVYDIPLQDETSPTATLLQYLTAEAVVPDPEHTPMNTYEGSVFVAIRYDDPQSTRISVGYCSNISMEDEGCVLTPSTDLFYILLPNVQY